MSDKDGDQDDFQKPGSVGRDQLTESWTPDKDDKGDDKSGNKGGDKDDND
jgi:hypothetical protein